MDITVRDLLEHLGTFLSEMRVFVEAETKEGLVAIGDNYTLRRVEDRVSLCITGVDIQAMPFGV